MRAACLCVLLAGCGGEDVTESCDPPSRIVDGACRAPGVQDDGCAAGEQLASGACRPAGLVAELCATGFVFDAERRSCEPVLPDACPDGELALPGETSCRPVMACPSEPWGGIPREANNQYVDAAYAGTSSGSREQPWRSIVEALGAAADGAIVAVAAGNYAGDVLIERPVRLWGECPGRVTIAGDPGTVGAVQLMTGADGSELRGLAITGASHGLYAGGVEDLALDALWVHDTLGRGLDIEDAVVAGTRHASSLVLRGSLIESAHDLGIFLAGANATIEATVVRETLPHFNSGSYGRGIGAQNGLESLARGAYTLTSLVVENNRDFGIFVGGATITLAGSVVRGTTENGPDSGIGIEIVPGAIDLAPADATLSSSLVAGNQTAGIVFEGTGSIEGVVVRDTLPASDGTLGRGISVQDGPGAATVMAIRSSLVERNHDVGILLAGVEATLEGILVRDTLPMPAAPGFGRGLGVQQHPLSGASASATVRGSAIERGNGFGLFVQGSQAELIGVAIGATAANEDGTYGDGLVAFPTETALASATLDACAVDDNERAGIAFFGATGSVANSRIACNSLDLVVQRYLEQEASLFDGGANDCSCAADAGLCKAIAADLLPPP